MEEEFTVARLFVSKMKSEAKNLVSRAATLEQQQAEANRKTEEMEKELSESRLTIVQVGLEYGYRQSMNRSDPKYLRLRITNVFQCVTLSKNVSTF